MKPAMLFPGQGAQFVGMGADLLRADPAAGRVLERAGEILDLDLAGLILEGPEEQLDRTEICQPAILATSLAILACLDGSLEGLRAHFHGTAGLSLGEYSALVFSGALRLDDAVAIVRKRGRYMQECSDRYPSGMVSLLGADEESAARICERAREGGIANIANLNGGGQVVVSGDLEAMKLVVEIAADFGVRRAIPLKVSGAFHSERMREAADRLVGDLDGIEIRKPQIAFLSNVTGSPVEDPQEIRRALAQQVVSPVRWEHSVRWLLESDVDCFVEPGPGKVLTGLVKKIDRSAATLTVSTPEEVRSVREALDACPNAGRPEEAR